MELSKIRAKYVKQNGYWNANVINLKINHLKFIYFIVSCCMKLSRWKFCFGLLISASSISPHSLTPLLKYLELLSQLCQKLNARLNYCLSYLNSMGQVLNDFSVLFWHHCLPKHLNVTICSQTFEMLKHIKYKPLQLRATNKRQWYRVYNGIVLGRPWIKHIMTTSLETFLSQKIILFLCN